MIGSMRTSKRSITKSKKRKIAKILHYCPHNLSRLLDRLRASLIAVAPERRGGVAAILRLNYPTRSWLIGERGCARTLINKLTLNSGLSRHSPHVMDAQQVTRADVFRAHSFLASRLYIDGPDASLAPMVLRFSNEITN